MKEKYSIEVPGDIADAIYSNIDAFAECDELIALVNKSLQTMERLSFQRKWTKNEVEKVIHGLEKALSNTMKYPSQKSKEYKLLDSFKQNLQHALKP